MRVQVLCAISNQDAAQDGPLEDASTNSNFSCFHVTWFNRWVGRASLEVYSYLVTTLVTMLAPRQAIRTAAASLRGRLTLCAGCQQRQMASKPESSAEARPSKGPSHRTLRQLKIPEDVLADQFWYGTSAAPSILKAGTVMKGLSVVKDQPDPIALPDDQYPAWLWGLTDAATAKAAEGKDAARQDRQGAESGKEGGEFDFKAERRRLRAA